MTLYGSRHVQASPFIACLAGQASRNVAVFLKLLLKIVLTHIEAN